MENRAIRIALIGDYDPQVTAHQAIPVALDDRRAVATTCIRLAGHGQYPRRHTAR
jgi:hypothetical protein